MPEGSCDLAWARGTATHGAGQRGLRASSRQSFLVIDLAPARRGGIGAPHWLAALWHPSLERMALALKGSALAFAFRVAPVIRLEGRLVDGCRAGIVTAGVSPALEALVARLMPSVERRSLLGRYPLLTLPWHLHELAAAAGFAAVRTERHASRLLGSGALRVPELVDAVLTVPAEEGLPYPSQSARTSAARSRRAGLDYSVSHEPTDLQLLIRRYYLPHAAAVHGARATLRSSWILRAAFRRGGIIWVEQGGARLAGWLFAIEGKELVLVASGARDGEPGLRPYAGVATVAPFALDLARRHGLGRIDLGGCLPWLADPVLQAKRFWGAALRPRRRATHDLLLSWPAGSRVGAALVRGLAPIHRAGSHLVALTDGDPRGLERMRLPGVVVSHAAACREPNAMPSSRDVVDGVRRGLTG
jgi:hypothetical protein